MRGIDELNERAQFLQSIRGETPPDVWRAEWREVQAERQEYFRFEEALRSNPDESLRQVIELLPVRPTTRVG